MEQKPLNEIVLPPQQLVNQLEIAGYLRFVPILRVTPAGVAIVEGLLVHRSVQWESGVALSLDVDLPFVAVGRQAAVFLQLTCNQLLKLVGFIGPHGRSSGQHLVIHVGSVIFD